MNYARKIEKTSKRKSPRVHSTRRQVEGVNADKCKAAAKSSQRGGTRIQTNTPRRAAQASHGRRVLNPDSLNPGSPEAIQHGCKCPRMDNHNGAGYMGHPRVFVMDGSCPLHSRLSYEQTKV